MISRYENVVELVEASFKKYANLPAYTGLACTQTYRELDLKSAVFASYLRNELGLQPGDRFAIQLPNVLQFPVALYGAIRAGLVIVNINPLYTSREVKHQLADSGARLLLVLSNVARSAADIISETSVENVIVTDLGDELPFIRRHLINFIVKKIKKRVPQFHFDQMVTYTEVMSHKVKAFTSPSIDRDTLLMLQYTGGTTGISKGAMLSHGNLTSNVWQMITFMPQAFDEGREVYVACLPLYHIYALNLHALSGFSRGCHNILIPNPRDFDSIVKTLKNVPFTVFIGINTLFRALVRYENFKSVDFSKLKITSAGGMALTVDAAQGWLEMTGCIVFEGYGLTETSPVVTGNQHEDNLFGSIGKALPETEIVILDDDEKPVKKGESGELCIRGPQVMLGYWLQDQETANVMTDEGFFKTGDLAVEVGQGFYKIVDRKKDLILVSGFNVYPNEIEDVLVTLPGITECAAIGLLDDDCGEVVKIFAVRDDPSLTEEHVIHFCRENLTRYKVPKFVEFRDELPKSNVGKVLRRKLREKNISSSHSS